MQTVTGIMALVIQILQALLPLVTQLSEMVNNFC